MALTDKVSLYASTPAISFEPETLLGEAISELLPLHKHRILVGRGARIEGIVEPLDVAGLYRVYGRRVWFKRLSEVAKPRPPLLKESTIVWDAIAMMAREGYTTLLVDIGGVLGVFTAWDALRAVEPEEVLAPIAGLVGGTLPIVGLEAGVDDVLYVMGERGVQTVLVSAGPYIIGYADSMAALKGLVEGKDLSGVMEPVEVYAGCETPISAAISAMVETSTRVVVINAGWQPIHHMDESMIIEALARLKPAG
ncbi:MAG: CBS domain-containing protein [Aeropyrum sp.]|nr:CBS domain-containing protein [Aeropyrum sp.]